MLEPLSTVSAHYPNHSHCDILVTFMEGRKAMDNHQQPAEPTVLISGHFRNILAGVCFLDVVDGKDPNTRQQLVPGIQIRTPPKPFVRFCNNVLQAKELFIDYV